MTGLPRLRHDLRARRTSLPGILAVFLIASAFALTTPLAGGAEEAPETVADEVSPEVLPSRPVVETDPVVITTQRHAVPIDQVGAAVTVIQGEDLRRRPSRDVLQALREVPGVSVVQTGSRGGATSLFVRGGEADQNLVLIDGVQVNNGGGAYDFANLTTENIERIEIVRGPASGLYGSDAITSTIQIFTKRGRGPVQGSLEIVGGNYGTTEQVGQVSGGGDDYGFAASISHYQTHGIESFNNDAENTSLRFRGDWSPVGPVDVALTTWYTRSRFQFPTDFVFGAPDGGFPAIDPNQDRKSQEGVVGLDVGYTPTENWEHRLRVGYKDSRDDTHDDLDPIPSDFADAETKSRDRRFTTDYHTRWVTDLGDHVTSGWTAGFEYEVERFNQRDEVEVPPFPGVRTRMSEVRRGTAYYGQLELGVLEQVFFTGGLRYDTNSEFDDFTSPFGNVIWNIPGTTTRLRAAAGRGFKEPTFVENFGSAFVPGNPNLEPEKSDSWEVGVEQDLFDAKLQLALTWFHQDIEDLIAFIGPFGTPMARFDNVQKVENQGLEFAASFQLDCGVRGGLTYTYLDTETKDAAGGEPIFVEGEPLLRRPENSGAVWLAYEGERLYARVDAVVVESRLDSDFSVAPAVRVRTDSYVKLDLSLSYLVYAHPTNGFEFRVKAVGENLLDEDYQEAYGFQTAGASGRGGIELRF